MHTLTNWKAKRAGGRITIYGTEADGSAGKIVGVDVIDAPIAPRIYPIATDKNGVQHCLV